LQEWQEDLDHWMLLEDVCFNQLILEHHARMSCAQKKKREHEHIVLLMVETWRQEIRLWNEVNETIWNYWEIQVRNFAFDKLVASETNAIGKAMKVLLHYEDQIELGMGRPQWGSVCLANFLLESVPNGIVLDSSETELPVPKMFLLLLDQDSPYMLDHTILWWLLEKIWHEHKLSPDLVLGIRCNTIMSRQ
jgi:hypothetical protein